MFSRYDDILSPIMIYNTDLKPIYANECAVRSFPLLAGGSLDLFYKKDSLLQIRTILLKGRPVKRRVDSTVPLELLFDPQLEEDGRVSFVRLFPCNTDTDHESLLVYNQAELIRVLNRDLAVPIREAYATMDSLSDDPVLQENLRVGQVHRRTMKLLRMAARSLVRIDDSGTLAAQKIYICNADAALQLCEEVYTPMTYESEGAFYIPVGRDMFLQIVADVLVMLNFRQTKESRIRVSADREGNRWCVLFRAGDLQFETLRQDSTSFDDLFSSYCKLISCGGEIKVDKEGRNAVRVKLYFPDIQISKAEITVGDYTTDGISLESAIAMDYLRSLCEDLEG